MTNIYDFKVNNIDGQLIDFSQFKGKKLMLVNVASECGLTPQYEQLEELYQQMGAEKFEIIAFPANDFAGQEPGSNQEIKIFCTTKYNVSFTMMEKISVKGENQHPIYQWLTQASKNGVADAEVSWNFQKFLIDENGLWVKSVSPQTLPIDNEVLSWLEE